jgi:dihydroneopterin aldolase
MNSTTLNGVAAEASRSAQSTPAADGRDESGLDAIQISGIRCYGYTGYFPEEQVLGQWFEVDLTIWMDLSVTGSDDQLENTLNYADVVERVTNLLETSRFKTIEKLNAVIIEAVLAFPPVRKVHSRLVKVSPPIPRFEGRIAIAMTRSKGDQA